VFSIISCYRILVLIPGVFGVSLSKPAMIMGLSFRGKRCMCQEHQHCGIKRRAPSGAAGAFVDGQIVDAQLAFPPRNRSGNQLPAAAAKNNF
jgi:hypothetical protein